MKIKKSSDNYYSQLGRGLCKLYGNITLSKLIVKLANSIVFEKLKGSGIPLPYYVAVGPQLSIESITVTHWIKCKVKRIFYDGVFRPKGLILILRGD